LIVEQTAFEGELMIVGNRNAGKTVAVAAIAMLIMMFVITLLVSMRKRTVPTQQPPLHPSVIVVLSASPEMPRRDVRLATPEHQRLEVGVTLHS
jgi:hypothetical protein